MCIEKERQTDTSQKPMKEPESVISDKNLANRTMSIGKDDLNNYLKELSKELKKEFGRKARFELVLVGGASVLLNYNFRSTTTDLDGFLSNKQEIKDAIQRVADKKGLSSGWLNSDFLNTDSYSANLVQYSKPYRIFNQILSVRTIADEYLVAMKIKSYRPYKNDLSDIVGTVAEMQKNGNNITIEKVKNAYQKLYNLNFLRFYTL